MAEQKVNPENLVVLIVSRRNTCYFEVMPLEELTDRRFVLNLKEGSWTWEDSERLFTRPIGDYICRGRDCGEGDIIGVFDKTNVGQLQLMVFAAVDQHRRANAPLI